MKKSAVGWTLAQKSHVQSGSPEPRCLKAKDLDTGFEHRQRTTPNGFQPTTRHRRWLASCFVSITSFLQRVKAFHCLWVEEVLSLHLARVPSRSMFLCGGFTVLHCPNWRPTSPQLALDCRIVHENRQLRCEENAVTGQSAPDHEEP